MYLLRQLIAVLVSVVSINTTGAELAIKYEFVPSHEQLYKTSIVKPAKTVKPLEILIIAPPVVKLKTKLPDIQVISSKNYADLQPLSPTISYSYAKASSTIPPESVVIPAINYSAKIVNLTYSDVYADHIRTYIVNHRSGSVGYRELSKGELNNIEHQIIQNTLIGCAPLSINCSRTATASAKLNIERGPLKPVEAEGSAERQLIRP